MSWSRWARSTAGRGGPGTGHQQDAPPRPSPVSGHYRLSLETIGLSSGPGNGHRRSSCRTVELIAPTVIPGPREPEPIPRRVTRRRPDESFPCTDSGYHRTARSDRERARMTSATELPAGGRDDCDPVAGPRRPPRWPIPPARPQPHVSTGRDDYCSKRRVLRFDRGTRLTAASRGPSTETNPA